MTRYSHIQFITWVWGCIPTPGRGEHRPRGLPWLKQVRPGPPDRGHPPLKTGSQGHAVAPVLPVRDPGGHLALPKLHIQAWKRPRSVIHVSLPVNKYSDRLKPTSHGAPRHRMWVSDTEWGGTQVSPLTARGLFCHLCLLALNAPLTSHPKMRGHRSSGKFLEPDF